MNNSMGQIVARVKAQVHAAAAENNKQQVAEKKKPKGLEFMAMRFNVVDKRRDLQRRKLITPAESCLLQEIELGTIGARNKKKKMGSQAEFYLEDLSANLGYKSVNKIWALLKSLQAKGLILRQATRSKGLELIGLNPEVFGQILIDKEHEKEKKAHLRLVHNSESDVDKSESAHTNPVEATHEVCAVHTRSRRDEHTNRVSVELENSPLDSFRLNLDSSKGEPQNGESFTLLEESGPGTKTPPKDYEAEIARQIAEMHAALGRSKSLQEVSH